MGIQMRVNPYQTQAANWAQGLRHGAPGAHRARMVAADHQRLVPLAQGLFYRVCQLLREHFNHFNPAAGLQSLGGDVVTPGYVAAGVGQGLGYALVAQGGSAPLASAIAGTFTHFGTDQVQDFIAHATLRSTGRTAFTALAAVAAAVAQPNKSFGSCIAGTRSTVLPIDSFCDKACT